MSFCTSLIYLTLNTEQRDDFLSQNSWLKIIKMKGSGTWCDRRIILVWNEKGTFCPCCVHRLVFTSQSSQLKHRKPEERRGSVREREREKQKQSHKRVSSRATHHHTDLKKKKTWIIERSGHFWNTVHESQHFSWKQLSYLRVFDAHVQSEPVWCMDKVCDVPCLFLMQSFDDHHPWREYWECWKLGLNSTQTLSYSHYLVIYCAIIFFHMCCLYQLLYWRGRFFLLLSLGLKKKTHP